MKLQNRVSGIAACKCQNSCFQWYLKIAGALNFSLDVEFLAHVVRIYILVFYGKLNMFDFIIPGSMGIRQEVKRKEGGPGKLPQTLI